MLVCTFLRGVFFFARAKVFPNEGKWHGVAVTDEVGALACRAVYSVLVQTSRTFACRALRSVKVSGRLVSSRRRAEG